MTFGSANYSAFKTQCRSAGDPQSKLQIVDPAQMVEARLLSAVVKCYKAHPDRTELQSLCQTSRYNEREGSFRHLEFSVVAEVLVQEADADVALTPCESLSAL